MLLLLIILLALLYCVCSKQGGNDGKYIIYTSNKDKANEYIRFGIPNLEVKENIDIKEVLGTPREVIIYKALEMPEGTIVEDTSLDVEGEQVGVKVRALIDKLLEGNLEGRKATWRVLIGHHDDGKIHIYEGITEGKLTKPRGEGFGFDPIFQPNESEKTLAELGKEKDNFSARRRAVENLLNNKSIEVVEVDTVPEWTGEYQL